MGNVLMHLRGSAWISNSWKQELLITDDGVEAEVVQGFKRIKMHLRYDRIAQVNLVRGVLRADIELVNKGGTDNLIVKALDKREAEQAKQLIERQIQSAQRELLLTTHAPRSVADELKKLAELREEGVISTAEFEAAKAKLLS